MAGSRSMPISCICPSATPLISEHLMDSTCLYGGPWIEHGVEWWSNWMYRIVTLLSLASHLILAVFPDIRRRKRIGLRRGLVWVAYQLTDLAPAYVMGNLYIETSRREKMIFAFWVPFLLLHSARPDSISAYSMEDSGLSLRVIIVSLFQTLGSIYLMYRYILVDCIFTGSLLWASCIMMFLCIFKYAESAVALRRADLGNIWSSFKQRQQHPSSLGQDYGRGGKLEPDDEKILLFAHDLFDICKGAFCDYLVDLDRHETGISLFKSVDWKIMRKVVEMELSLMYDILYTKAAVVHTWGGYAIRMMSPPLTAIALLLFGLHHKEGMPAEDEAISYVLLSLTLLLDVTWLFRALASAWTRSFLKRMPNRWPFRALASDGCSERWEKLRRFVVLPLSRVSLCLWTCECSEEPKSYRRRWAGSLGQRNFLDSCTRGLFDTLCRNVLDNCTRGGGTLYSSYSVLRELSIKFKTASVFLFTRSPAPAEQVDPVRPSEQQPHHPPEFQEDVFIWHMATDVFIRCNAQVTSGYRYHKKAIEMISDYMMFLDIGKHDMLPGRKFHSVIDTACRIIKQKASSSKIKGNELAGWMLRSKDSLQTLGAATGEGTGGINKGYLADRARICISEGTQIAHELHHWSTGTQEAGLVAISRHAHWFPYLLDPPGNIEGMLEFILDVWVNMLVDASLRCSRESHAKQLSRGGELITIIWVATQHADVGSIKSKIRESFLSSAVNFL